MTVTCYASDTLCPIPPGGAQEVLCTDRQAVRLNRPTNCAFLGTRLLIAKLGGNHLAT